jgi:hypothetical protein
VVIKDTAHTMFLEINFPMISGHAKNYVP